ncbi:adenylyl-sulfate kinase [Burkholderia sp. ABCPW 14]|uniref:adenylyl-sulfate kinase n=1 Tax=Burkholderia sp. ABCPW 14 TaxID=1637860 RepID=UPI003FA4539E
MARGIVGDERFSGMYVGPPLAERERRDSKRPYRNAGGGQMPHVAGVASPDESPTADDPGVRRNRLTNAGESGGSETRDASARDIGCAVAIANPVARRRAFRSSGLRVAARRIALDVHQKSRGARMQSCPEAADSRRVFRWSER